MTNKEADDLLRIINHEGGDDAFCASLCLLAGVRRLNQSLADIKTLDDHTTHWTVGEMGPFVPFACHIVHPKRPPDLYFYGFTKEQARQAAADWIRRNSG